MNTFTSQVFCCTVEHNSRVLLTRLIGAASILKKQCHMPVQRKYANCIFQTAKNLLSFVNNSPEDTGITIRETSQDENNHINSINSQPYVLLVEDDPIIQLVHKKKLIGLGCRIDIAVNGDQAIKMSTDNKYDLILMDIGLPNKSGIEATEIIRCRESVSQKHTFIVGITGYTDDETHKRGMIAGMDDIITKPAETENLKELLKRFC